MSPTKAAVIIGCWSIGLAAFLRFVTYMDEHDLPPGYLGWPVFLFMAGGLLTFLILLDDES